MQNTMHMYNRFVYNPASAGMQNGTSITMLGRTQWVGIEGAPSLFNTSFNTPAVKLGGGVGGYVIGDRLGPLSTTGINLSYSYHFKFGDGGSRLGIGVQGGLLQKSLNGNFIYNTNNGLEPLVPLGNYNASVMVPNLGAGVYFNSAEDKFYVGVGAQDLLEPSIEGLLATGGVGEDSNVPRTVNFMTGYRIEFNERMSLQPSIFARTDFASYQFDLSALMRIQPLVFGASYRWGDSFSGIVGFDISDRLFLAYAYDYTISPLNINNDVNSHEIIINYTIPIGDGIDRGKNDVLDRPDLDLGN